MSRRGSIRLNRRGKIVFAGRRRDKFANYISPTLFDAVDEENFALLALSLTRGIGVVNCLKALSEVESATELLKLRSGSLRRMRLQGRAIASIVSGDSERRAEEAAEAARRKGVDIIGLKDARYPGLLKEIFDPPLVLYVAGNPAVLEEPLVSVVGARRCSVYGEQVTLFMAREFASMGICVTSGMARGIDSKAHLGALEGKGHTVAVLGTGVDVPYPRENRKLYSRILDAGCIVSEFPLGTFPAPQNFPVRNRIISGLSWGTLITEAAEFSGSLITARLALEQNRELWAVPGNITCKTSYGPNYLIKQGAVPLLSPAEIIDNLPVHVLRRLGTEEKPKEPERRREDAVSGDDLEVYGLLFSDRASDVDELVAKTGFSWPRLSEVLLRLETRGLIKRVFGNRYCKILRRG